MKNNWPDNLTIQQYLEGSLDKKLMHELEKRALEDPFLADALEGYAQTSTADHGLSILQRQLHERISHQQENKKVFDLSWQRLSVAAAAAVMFISAGVLFWMNSQLPDQKLVANNNPVEVNVMPADSLKKKTTVDNSASLAEIASIPEKPTPKSVTNNVDASRAESKISISEDNEKLSAASLNKSGNALAANRKARVSDAEAVYLNQKAEKLTINDSEEPAAPLNRLSEITFSRFSAAPDVKALPLDGWVAYRKYLQENISKASASLKQKGKVIVGFKVDQQGSLNDFKVLRGLSATADSLALQIIKSGPAWKAAADGKVSDLKIELDF